MPVKTGCFDAVIDRLNQLNCKLPLFRGNLAAFGVTIMGRIGPAKTWLKTVVTGYLAISGK